MQVIKTESNISKVKKSQEKASNRHLPPECHANGNWTKRVLPTLFRWAGNQATPFTIPEANILEALKVICCEVYGDSFVSELNLNLSSVALRLICIF